MRDSEPAAPTNFARLLQKSVGRVCVVAHSHSVPFALAAASFMPYGFRRAGLAAEDIGLVGIHIQDTDKDAFFCLSWTGHVSFRAIRALNSYSTLPMNALLMTHLPRDLAGIVSGYVVSIVRPFKPQQCLICGAAHTCKAFNLCPKHIEMCIFCFKDVMEDPIDDTICSSCYALHPWLSGMYYGYDSWEVCWSQSEPIDLAAAAPIAARLIAEVEGDKKELNGLRAIANSVRDRNNTVLGFTEASIIAACRAQSEAEQRHDILVSHMFARFVAEARGLPYTDDLDAERPERFRHLYG